MSDTGNCLDSNDPGWTGRIDTIKDPIWCFPTSDEVKENLCTEMSEDDKIQAWKEAAEAMKIYHDELVGRWQGEMDTLLVYAGLFSAVLTAFNVQSYQLLQPPSTDPTLAVLQQISAQLNSFSITPPFANSTHPAQSLDDMQAAFRAPSSAVWINTLWFSSLVCSLASASLSLVVKQWLQKQTIGLSGTSREVARLRQNRLNSLVKWRVGTFVVLLPILLQLALVLFLVGLVILLWTLHDTVAAITSSFVCMLFTLLAVVTVLPAFRWDCCYRSPQALAVYIAIRAVRNISARFIERAISLLYLWSLHGTSASLTQWMHKLLKLWSQREVMPTWHGRDQVNVAKSFSSLDRNIAIMAYTTTLSTSYLANLPLILSDISPGEFGSCFNEIRASWEEQWGDDTYRHSEAVRLTFLPRSLVYVLRRMLAIAKEDRNEDWERTSIMLVRNLHPLVRPASRQEDVESALDVLCQFSMIHDSSLSRTAFNTVTEFVLFRDAYANRHGQWNRSFLQVVTMSECIIRSWEAQKQTFETLQLWLMALNTVVDCVDASLKNDGPVPADQIERICDKAHDLLVYARDRLRVQQWKGLEEDITDGWEVRDSGIRANDVLLCALAYWLEEHVALPILAVCHTPRGRAIVPEGFIETLEHAWSCARDAHESSGRSNAARGVIPEAVALDTLHGTLLDLKAAVAGGLEGTHG